MARTNPTKSSGDSSQGDLRDRARETGTQLAESFHLLLSSLPDTSWRPQALATQLGQTVVTTSRLLRGVGHEDPLGVLLQMPGPQPLRRVVSAAKRRGADPKAIASATRAVQGFEDLIQTQAGGRSALASILASWRPEDRREFEMRRRQSLFKAMSELKGAQQELEILSVVLSPGADRECADLTVIQAALGLMRHRPGVVVEVAALDMDREESERAVDLELGKADGPFGPGSLDRYCVNPPAALQAHKLPGRTRYTLATEDFGRDSLADCLIAHHHLAAIPLCSESGNPRNPYFFNIQSFPVRKLMMDCFVHKDLLSDKEPRLSVHSVAGKGPAKPGDKDRDLDLIETHETVQVLGYGTRHLRLPEAPNYVPLVKEVFAHLGQDPEDYRVVRLIMDYPVQGMQVTIAHPVCPVE